MTAVAVAAAIGCWDRHEPPPQCPGCHRITRWLEMARGTGATRWSERLPSWCRRCLDRKVAEAIAEVRLWP